LYLLLWVTAPFILVSDTKTMKRTAYLRYKTIEGNTLAWRATTVLGAFYATSLELIQSVVSNNCHVYLHLAMWLKEYTTGLQLKTLDLCRVVHIECIEEAR
jgi:hypothetical protein